MQDEIDYEPGFNWKLSCINISATPTDTSEF